jgi:hypothetical protein
MHLIRLLFLFSVLVSTISVAVAAPPANNKRTNAEVLTGTLASVSTNNLETTTESGDDVSNALWWKWEAPENGSVLLDTQNSAATFLQMAVYLLEQNGNNAGLIRISREADRRPALSFPVSKGTKLLIAVGMSRHGGDGARGTIQFTLSQTITGGISSLPIVGAATMVNDSFSQRIELTGNLVSALAYNAQATTESGEPESTCKKTVWWKYRPESNGTLTLTTTHSDYENKVLGVFLGNQVNNLRRIDSRYATADITLIIPVTAGTEYQICMGGRYEDSTGTAILSLSLNTQSFISNMTIPHPATMANDNFASRLLLTGNRVGTVSYNGTATQEAGEPAVAGSRTFWWTYRAPANGIVSISSEGSTGSPILINVFQGTELSNLKFVAGKGLYNAVVSVQFPATANTEYQINMGTVANAADAYHVMNLVHTAGAIGALNLPLQASTGNDAFNNSITLPSNRVSVIGYNGSATREAGEPATTRNHTLWWKWTAAASGKATLDFTGSDNFGIEATIWTGSDIYDLTSQTRTIASATASFQAIAGTTYHIAVGSLNSGYFGSIVMTLVGPGGSSNPEPVKPVIVPASIPDGYVGQLIAGAQFTVTTGTAKFTATGLPPGVKMNATTGELTGRPAKAKIVKGQRVPYVVTVTATTGKVKSLPVTFEWLVEPLPTAVQGNFSGIIERQKDINGRPNMASGLGGLIQAKVTSRGAVSGSIKLAGAAVAFRGVMDPQSDGSLTFIAEMRRKAPLMPINLSLVISNSGVLSGFVSGDSASARIEGWRTHVEPTRAGNYLVSLDPGSVSNTRPSGLSFLSIKVSPAGVATLKGKLADGTALTASSALGESGKLSWHQMLYKNTGSVQGTLTLASASFTGNGDWNKEAQLKHVLNYQDGFALHGLTAAGGLYPKPVKGTPVLGLPSALALHLTHELSAEPIHLPVTLTDKNTLVAGTASPGLKITLSAATGLINGTYTLPDAEGGKTRKVIISAALIPGQGLGVGYFLLPINSTKGANVISGSAVLRPGL